MVGDLKFRRLDVQAGLNEDDSFPTFVAMLVDVNETDPGNVLCIIHHWRSE